MMLFRVFVLAIALVFGACSGDSDNPKKSGGNSPAGDTAGNPQGDSAAGGDTIPVSGDSFTVGGDTSVNGGDTSATGGDTSVTGGDTATGGDWAPGGDTTLPPGDWEMPATWTCPPFFYGVDSCDCGCGAPDPDCGNLGCIEPNCQDPNCASCWDGGSSIVSCIPIPQEWLCDWLYYDAQDGCDCGCGAPDPDCLAGEGCITPGCQDLTCDSCLNAAATDYIVCDPNGTGWSCDLTYYGADDGCDCGCTVPDPDCPVGTGCTNPGCGDAACDYCYDANGIDIVCP